MKLIILQKLTQDVEDFNIKYIQEKIKNIDITNANELLTLMEKYNYTDRNIDDGIFDENGVPTVLSYCVIELFELLIKY